ncbi:MAG: menaquinone biosynthesis decarboxylase [Candidatus Sumerlaea chitinivorans]|uniref:UbiD family decarboxylase associated with menaquinone via futalosine n=1 Tax=Sumerlaea chitinivorans TaxID=2250252 RepID=A0A2Z4Y8E5_SUMC1|nr:UbiD family decarboxylase associated with menaquinone via futalosine [Candidatus Sumerlaea chitinivorans]MCX7963433.1 menaquinone biosynthesis decarboxylase [Candidatus Sumerlaea chitinivorans]
MAYENLREFIAALEKAGELRRITVEVDPELEITEIADRVMKSPGGGKALLFENVRGSRMPILVNMFGSRRRMQMVCGSEKLSEITENFLALLESRGPMSFLEKLKMLPRLKQVSDIFPQEVRRAPCFDVVIEDPSFELLPVCKCWPKDGGRFITLPMVFSRDPMTGATNCGMYRLQIYDAKTCGMHWHLHKGGAEHLRRMKERGEVLPVTIVLGAGPAEIFSATVPLPPDVNEMMFAGLLRGSPVKVVKCRTNDLLIPAEAEIVLEGYVDPGELRLEGPFGDHTGYYSVADMYPVFHLTAMSMRRDPIYPHTIVGIPPMEDAYIGEAIEELFTPILRKQFPEIVDMHMPVWGCFHNVMIVAIRKAYPGHARKVMHGIWGLGQAMFTKLIIVVDHDVNIRNYGELVWRASNSVDYSRDVEIVKGPVDDLDHASVLPRYGGKMGIDATTKWPSEGYTREWPEIIRMSDEVKKRIDSLWPSLGLD